MDWQELAECRDINPSIFHTPERAADAKAVCRPCPVKDQCLALRHGAAGVWGGKVFYPSPRRQR
jgi:hypothetical protein